MLSTSKPRSTASRRRRAGSGSGHVRTRTAAKMRRELGWGGGGGGGGEGGCKNQMWAQGNQARQDYDIYRSISKYISSQVTNWTLLVTHHAALLITLMPPTMALFSTALLAGKNKLVYN